MNPWAVLGIGWPALCLGFALGAAWCAVTSERREAENAEALWQRIKAQLLQDAIHHAAAVRDTDAVAQRLPPKLRAQQHARTN